MAGKVDFGCAIGLLEKEVFRMAVANPAWLSDSISKVGRSIWEGRSCFRYVTIFAIFFVNFVTTKTYNFRFLVIPTKLVLPRELLSHILTVGLESAERIDLNKQTLLCLEYLQIKSMNL